MKKSLCVVAVAAAMMLLAQDARAGDDACSFPGDQRLVLPSVAVGMPLVGGWPMNSCFNHHAERDSVPPSVEAMRHHHHRHHHG